MHFYRRKLHEGVAACCRERGWILDSYDHSPDLSPANQWDGIILLHQSVPELQGFLKKGVPVVTLAMDDAGAIQLPAVIQDQAAIGAMGVGHLLERGFKRLVFCGFNDAISHARFRGARAAAIRHGSTVHEVCVPHRAPKSKGASYLYEWLRDHLLSQPPPFGVLAAHDLLGVTVLDACARAGLKVPAQVAVAGVDNDELVCDCAPIPLSSVDNDLFQHGYEAARFLGEIVGGKSGPRPLLIQPRRVIVRASTDTIAAQDGQLAAILQTLHERAGDPFLTVKSICEDFKLSRRALWEMFVQAKLAPPGQLIHDMRLRKACVKLAEGGQTIQQIARACGFGSPRSFGRYFRQVKGASPEQWRQSARA